MAFTRVGNQLVGTDSGENANLAINTDYQGVTEIYAYGGNDRVDGGVYSETIYGGDGNDVLNGTSGLTPYPRPWYWPDENQGDTIYGENGDDILTGDESADELYGGNGADELIGSGGGDFMSGGAGDDEYVIALASNGSGSDAGPDVINELQGGGTDQIRFNDLDYQDFSFNVEIEEANTDLWVSSATDVSDGTIDQGVIIKDFFALVNDNYTFNTDNVVEEVYTADNYIIDLTSIDLDALNDAYHSSQLQSVEIA